MTDEQLRIHGYLVAQGAKLAPAAAIEKVRAAMADLRAAADEVPPARFSERPEPEEWSANEVLAHVVAAGAHFGDAIVSALDDRPQPPRAEGRGIEGAPARTAAEWCDLLDQDREALFARVLRAAPGAHLDRVIEHGMFGPLNWRETVLFMRIHDLDHAGQLKKIAAALSAPRTP